VVFCASRLIFQSLWWISLEYLWELHWTCRFILAIYLFSECWFDLFLSMGDHSIFCNFHWFISSVVLRLKSFTSFVKFNARYFIFSGYCKWNCFPVFSIYSLLVYRKVSSFFN
jgi:hypothetical protein